jgi:hypothetical protein
MKKSIVSVNWDSGLETFGPQSLTTETGGFPPIRSTNSKTYHNGKRGWVVLGVWIIAQFIDTNSEVIFSYTII